MNYESIKAFMETNPKDLSTDEIIESLRWIKSIMGNFSMQVKMVKYELVNRYVSNGEFDRLIPKL